MRVGEGLKSLVSSFILEPLLLRSAERTARAYTPDQQKRLRELVAAVRQREWVAREVRDDSSLAAALSLLCEAVSLSVSAVLVARAELDGAVLSAPDAAMRLESLLQAPPLSKGAESFAILKPVLVDTDPLALDRLSKEKATEARTAAEQILALLLGQLEPRSPRAIRVQRGVRIGLLATAVAVSLWALVAAATAPTNLAPGKQVKQSSTFPGTPECSGLVDGRRDGPFGCHTAVELNAWVMIDLLDMYAIKEVVVYNRSDGYQTDILPLTLELSEDGRSFQEAGVRQELFTDSKPWRVSVGGRRARYLKFIVKRRSYIALQEVEVFGNRF